MDSKIYKVYRDESFPVSDWELIDSVVYYPGGRREGSPDIHEIRVMGHLKADQKTYKITGDQLMGNPKRYPIDINGKTFMVNLTEHNHFEEWEEIKYVSYIPGLRDPFPKDTNYVSSSIDGYYMKITGKLKKR